MLAGCAICSFESHWLGAHIQKVHGLTPDQYRMEHPGDKLYSPSLGPSAEKSLEEGVCVYLGESLLPVDLKVPLEACLELPEDYMPPEQGLLGRALAETVIAFANRRHTYLHGLPGSGKDAFVHAYSALTRTPAKLFQISPDTNIQAWLYSLRFDGSGTKVQEGALLKALRDGYTLPSGEKRPYLILLSDFDRASRDQAEALRLILDSIKGRIMGFDGQVYTVFPGTLIVATANSVGSGDMRGRCISARPIDASLMDRFQRFFEFPWMEWADEGPVVKVKFPHLFEKIPDLYEHLDRATTRLRRAIADETVVVEFGHRGLCRWLGHAQDVLYSFPDMEKPVIALKRGLKAYLDGMPDEHAREAIRKILDPHLPGGALEEGDTLHIGERLSLGSPL